MCQQIHDKCNTPKKAFFYPRHTVPIAELLWIAIAKKSRKRMSDQINLGATTQTIFNSFDGVLHLSTNTKKSVIIFFSTLLFHPEHEHKHEHEHDNDDEDDTRLIQWN